MFEELDRIERRKQFVNYPVETLRVGTVRVAEGVVVSGRHPLQRRRRLCNGEALPLRARRSPSLAPAPVRRARTSPARPPAAALPSAARLVHDHRAPVRVHRGVDVPHAQDRRDGLDDPRRAVDQKLPDVARRVLRVSPAVARLPEPLFLWVTAFGKWSFELFLLTSSSRRSRPCATGPPLARPPAARAAGQWTHAPRA